MIVMKVLVVMAILLGILAVAALVGYVISVGGER